MYYTPLTFSTALDLVKIFISDSLQEVLFKEGMKEVIEITVITGKETKHVRGSNKDNYTKLMTEYQGHISLNAQANHLPFRTTCFKLWYVCNYSKQVHCSNWWDYTQPTICNTNTCVRLLNTHSCCKRRASSISRTKSLTTPNITAYQPWYSTT